MEVIWLVFFVYLANRWLKTHDGMLYTREEYAELTRKHARPSERIEPTLFGRHEVGDSGDPGARRD